LLSDSTEEQDLLGQIRLTRSLTLWQATGRSLQVTAVSIVFALMGGSVGAAGSLAPLGILLAALLITLNNLGYADLVASAPSAGGAYTLVRDRANNGWLAFLTGLALAVSGLGLCALLAQSAAGQLQLLLAGYIAVDAPVELLGLGLVALGALWSILHGAWRRRLSLALPVALLLSILVLLATPRIQVANYAAPRPRLDLTIAALLVAFLGLEATTGRGGEIRRRTVDLPRAVLFVPALAGILGAVATTLTIGVLGVQQAAGDAPLAAVGGVAVGPVGHLLVLVAGIAALFTAQRRTLTMTVRLLYAMSRDGFLPEGLHRIHPRLRGPTRLTLLTGLLVLPLVWAPAGLLAQAGGLLVLLALMSINLTLARQTRQPSGSSAALGAVPRFALPFHPWIPALTLAVDALMLPLWDLPAIACAAGLAIVGGLAYLAYGRSHFIEAKEGIVVFRSAPEEQAPAPVRVLVPITTPARAGGLLRLAHCIARAQGGEVLALQVVPVAEPLPLEAGRWRAQAERELLEKAIKAASGEELPPIQVMTRVARSAAQGILETAAEEGANLILMRWHGPVRSRMTSLGPILDAVLRDAQCDVMIVRGEDVSSPARILVPTAGGPHARAATRIASALVTSCDAELTLLCVRMRPLTPEEAETERCQIEESLERLHLERPPSQKIVQAASVVDGIAAEAQAHDLVLVGVSDESLLDRLVFGDVPLQVAARVAAAALVQGDRGITGLWTRRLLRTLRSTLPALNDEEQLKVRQALVQGARPGINYFVLIILSCVIAALGLLLDSPAVVIGAMLVAPLMSPILAFSLGLALGDLRLIRFSTEAILKGVALAIIIASFIGLFSPLKLVTGEMLARAQPTLLDLVVALASGMAGAYALARKDVSAALPGVAIAAALMPPLATVGLGLSLGDGRVAGGALLLFAANIAAISLAGGIVFLALGIRPQRWGPESRRRLRRRLIASLLLLLVISIPLGIILAGIVRDATTERAVEAALVRVLAEEEGQLMSLEIERGRTALLVVATVRSVQPFEQTTVDNLAQMLSDQLDARVQLELIVFPVVQSGE
jgi:uncharacterized hydrophobic protein (TIGR00271 family)